MKNKILTENPKPNTKEKILFAAKTEFLQKGFMGTNVRSIAKKAGVTKVVFDRNGRKYAGRLQALAEAARKEGLEF